MRAAVWGSPIAHSLSPALHRAAYAALGLDWRYDLREVDAAGLPAAVAALDTTWAGVSLTMPLKVAVLPLLAQTSPLALAVGAVNTLLPLSDGAGERSRPLAWRGENTDVHGVVAALAEAGVSGAAEPGRPRAAVVLGGGATAASALAALAELGATEPVVVVRSPERAAALVAVGERLGVDVRLQRWAAPEPVAEVLAGADVVVSTAPVGAADGVAEVLGRAPSGSGGPRGALLDVVYAPWPTALGAAWAAAGAPVVGGFAMLLHQACRQVELMTGRPAPVEAMRAAGPADAQQLLTR